MTEHRAPARRTDPASTGAWLLPDTSDVQVRVSAAVAEARHDDHAQARRLGLLAKAAQLTLAAEIRTRLREALHDNLADLLIAGIARHGSLRDAARSTLASPGADAVVSLGRHRVSTHQEPSVDVYVDQTRVITLGCELDLEFDVAEVRGVVRAARLVSLAMPSPEVRGALRIHGHEIHRNRGTLRLASQLDLGAGVRLLSRDEIARLT